MSRYWYNRQQPREEQSLNAMKQVNTQKQTVDQNYANGILFMAMSTLETLENKLRGQNINRKYKEFGNYDFHDYSYKEGVELMGQLRNNVMLLASSKLGFEKVYGKNQYMLPQNYDEKNALQRLSTSRNFFLNMREQNVVRLIDDMMEIIGNNKTQGLNYQKMFFEDGYSAKKKNQEFFNEGVRATNLMQEEEKKVSNNFKNPKELEFNTNKNYSGQTPLAVQSSMVQDSKRAASCIKPSTGATRGRWY